MRKRRQLHSRRVSISSIWTRVTAAHFHLQQSPCASPRLTPALLPIGGVRHQILTGSMRFLHTPPTGKHSTGAQRRDVKESWEAEMRRRESGESSKLRGRRRRSEREREREGEKEQEAAAPTWNKRRLQWFSLRRCWHIKNAGIPCSFSWRSGTKKQMMWGWKSLSDTLSFYFYMSRNKQILLLRGR